MSQLLNLPIEIIHNLSDYLDAKDKASFIATCSQLRAILSSSTWRDVYVKCSNNNSRTNSPSFSPPKKTQLTRRKPYIIKRMGDPVEICKNRTEFKKIQPLRINEQKFGEFCREAVATGYYDTVFTYVRNLTIELTMIDKCEYEELLGDDKVNNGLTDLQYGYWFLINAIPKFKNLKSIQLSVRLGENVGSLKDTILPKCIKGWNFKEINIGIEGRIEQRIEGCWDNESSSGPSMVRLGLVNKNNCKTKCIQLPNSLKRLDLVFDKLTGFTSLKLQSMLRQCTQLKSLLCSEVRILDNDHNHDWIPDSVTNLSLQAASSNIEYFMVPKQILPNVKFLHIDSDSQLRVLDYTIMSQINESFPNITTFAVERFKVDYEFTRNVQPLLPRLDHFKFLDMYGMFFEELDIRIFLSAGLETLNIGQVHFDTSDLINTLDVSKPLSLLRVRPSGMDFDYFSVITALARFTSNLQLDLQLYRWDANCEEIINGNDMFVKIPDEDQLVSYHVDNSQAYLFKVDLEKV